MGDKDSKQGRGMNRRDFLEAAVSAGIAASSTAGCLADSPEQTRDTSTETTSKTTTEAVGNQTTARNQEPELDIPEWLGDEVDNPKEDVKRILTRTSANLKDNANRHEQLDDLFHFSYARAGRNNRREAIALCYVATDNLHTEGYDNFNVGQDTHILPDLGILNGILQNGTAVFIDENGNQRCQFGEPDLGGGLKDAKGSEAYTIEGENYEHVSFASGHAVAGYVKRMGYLDDEVEESDKFWEDLHTNAALSLNGIIPRQNGVATDFQTQLEVGRRRTNPDEGNIVEFTRNHLDAVRQAQKKQHSEKGVYEQVIYENGEFRSRPKHLLDVIDQYEEDLINHANSL
ncbi:hypothetical protein [Candidatus Nanohalococcus occultus]|uniref:Uncharacterized protein n=1 Tax=Candidatus Nanohalococcus occultus TaxID=2978047 RepID=A0ABY8CHG3_9ARCH|nr:hypothetical protein SVXNc_0416 [Candidatus Nanohaloarchaeota archaeon SVXNc]